MKNGQQVLPTNRPKREELRNKGQFWTPHWVAKAMIEYVVKDAKMIFDPATGEGAFFKALQEIHPTIGFYGIDIDDNVLASPNYRASHVHVENRDFLKDPPTQKFTAIVGNPPYIRHHRIDEETKAYLKHLTTTIIGTTIDGRAGYHIYFLLQALQSLDTGGRLAFIMPADTCEGVFATKLWQWITKKYCLECVVAFAPEAAPFPNVDTNALIFFIKNQKPLQEITWAKVISEGDSLRHFVQSNFEESFTDEINISRRSLQEAIETGLSRANRDAIASSTYTLGDFATTMRGIATGANEFFFLTKEQITKLDIPPRFFKRTVGRTRDISHDTLTMPDMDTLDNIGRPTFLLSVEESFEDLPPPLQRYIQQGVEAGLPQRALIGLRKPWYRTEKRAIPELLFAYLGRRNIRFIRNTAQVLPLHCLHCVYTYSKDPQQIENLWKVFNHPDTLALLGYVSKSYGAGALKVEPQNLKKLPIPEHLVSIYNLQPKNFSPTHDLFV